MKQVLHRLNLIPREIERLYDDRNRSSTDTSVLVRHLISLISHFSAVFVMFDALDECANDNYTDMIDLICQLRESNVRIMCTSRINTSTVRTELGMPELVEIEGRSRDLRNFLSNKLKKKIEYDEQFKEEILNTLVERAESAAGKSDLSEFASNE